jgi:hypothetical protein
MALRDLQTGSQYWLVFNARGEIGHCSDALARLLGRESAEMNGLAVASILPRLPLKRESPDGNLGALKADFVHRRRSLDLILGTSLRLPVYAWMQHMQLSRGPVFVVELSPRNRGQGHDLERDAESVVATQLNEGTT